MDLGAIRELALIAEEFGLMEIEADPSGHVRISRRGPDVQLGVGAGPAVAVSSPAAPAIALAPAAVPEAPPTPGLVVTSPFVGTFYRAPSPEASPFASVGDNVKKGQVVCIVEAMKLMNEIEAEVEGRVSEILVKNGEHVEYGQALIRLLPA
ncbi:MAG TPA: acetyl-CoA carboxylase biotin carboxyl carrier protein [Polyangia bacterium]